MALINENMNGHGSYLAAVAALVDSLSLTSGERIPERRVVEIARHIFSKSHCNKCDSGFGLETVESSLQEMLAVEAYTVILPSVLVDISDGAGEIVIRDPLVKIVEFLSERRLRRSGNSLMVTSARMANGLERFVR